MGKLFSYNRKEKLKSKKQFAQLFDARQSFFIFPVKIFYLLPSQQMDNTVKAGVGVNSRNFKKAVHRNRIKRLLREAYRLHKLPLHQHLEQQNRQVIVFFLFADKVLPQGGLLQTKMPVIIRELIKRLNEEISHHT